jgi:hypothetical protein
MATWGMATEYVNDHPTKNVSETFLTYFKGQLLWTCRRLRGPRQSNVEPGPCQCALFLIPRSFHDGGALNYSTAPHRSKTTLISNGVFCLLESKILSIGQTLLYSLV